jgi:hypothetical protein
MRVRVRHRLSYPATLHEWILQLAGVPPEANGLINRFIPFKEEHVKMAELYAKYGGYPPSWDWGSEFQKFMMIAESVEDGCRFIKDDDVRVAYLRLADYMKPYFENYRKVSEETMEYCEYWNGLVIDGIKDMLDMLGLNHEFNLDVYHIPYPPLPRGCGKGGANIPGESAVYVWDGLDNFKTTFYYAALWHEVFHVLLGKSLRGGPSLIGEILCMLVHNLLECKYFLSKDSWQPLLISKISFDKIKFKMKDVIEGINHAKVEREVLDESIRLNVEVPDMTLIFEGRLTSGKSLYELEVLEADRKLILVDYRDGRPVFRLRVE